MGMLARAKHWIAEKAYTLQQFRERFIRLQDDGDSLTSGIDISRPYAQSTWVNSCISLIARNLGRVPFILERGKTQIKSGALYDLKERPNRYHDWYCFVTQTMTHLLHDGQVFWQRAEQTGYRARQIIVQSRGELDLLDRIDEFGKRVPRTWIIKQIHMPLIPYDEIFQWKLENPYDNIEGLSPIEAAKLAIWGDVGSGVYNKNFFINGATSPLIFSTEDQRFTQTQAEQALESWNAKHQGAKHAHRAAFLGNGLKPFPSGRTQRDMEYSKLALLSKAQILAIYNVPESLLGAPKPVAGVVIGGDNRQGDAENFFNNTVVPWGELLASWWNRVVAEPYGDIRGRFHWDTIPVIQDRLLNRAKEGREWIKAGATYNDVIAKFDLDLQRQPHGDDWWVPSNTVPARMILDGTVRPGSSSGASREQDGDPPEPAAAAA